MDAKGRVLTGDMEAYFLVPDIREGHREDLHVIHLKDYHTGELFTFFDDFEDRRNAVWLDEFEEGYKQGDIAEGVKWMEECELLIMQNVSGYDAHAITKTMGKFDREFFEPIDNELFPFNTADTYTMSCVLNPERKLHPSAYILGLGNTGPHSIAAHGIRMGRHKPEHEDWTHLSKEMLHRVEEDVEIGEDLFTYLMNEWDEQMERPNKATGKCIADAYLVEFRMAFTVALQAQRGFAIDVAFLSSLLPTLDEEITQTEADFRPHMPLRIKMKKQSTAMIEKNSASIQCFGIKPGEYSNFMFNGDQRGSAGATYWAITKKNGEYMKNVTKYIPQARGFMQDHDKPPVSGPFTPLVWEEIPLGNRDAVKQILYKHGWRGVTYNEAETEFIEETGELPKPWAGKIDDVSLLKWEASAYEVPEWCKGIARWYILQSRRTQILNKKDTDYYDEHGKWPRQLSKKHECRGLLAKARCYDSGKQGETAMSYYEREGSWPTTGHWRVSAEAFACATNTFRMRHKTVVNIPSRGLYGKEMRRMFIAAPGKMIVGCDASGLELRMLAHFMNDPEFTKVILEGDVHDFNTQKAGFRLEDTTEVFGSARDMAKKFIYMFLYGSGIPNLARQMGLSRHMMTECKDNFEAGLPSLKNLVDRVQASARAYGYLLSVDGRWGRIRSKGKVLSLNTALNVLLQMTGSILMKYAHAHAEDCCARDGLIDSISDFPIVVHQHDEFQGEVEECEVEVMKYPLAAEDWKQEKKMEHHDSGGRLWSTPVKEELEDGSLECTRYYHPIGEQYCKSLTWAGEELKLRCETAGEYKIGRSWQDTH